MATGTPASASLHSLRSQTKCLQRLMTLLTRACGECAITMRCLLKYQQHPPGQGTINVVLHPGHTRLLRRLRKAHRGRATTRSSGHLQPTRTLDKPASTKSHVSVSGRDAAPRRLRRRGRQAGEARRRAVARPLPPCAAPGRGRFRRRLVLLRPRARRAMTASASVWPAMHEAGLATARGRGWDGASTGRRRRRAAAVLVLPARQRAAGAAARASLQSDWRVAPVGGGGANRRRRLVLEASSFHPREIASLPTGPVARQPPRRLASRAHWPRPARARRTRLSEAILEGSGIENRGKPARGGRAVRPRRPLWPAGAARDPQTPPLRPSRSRALPNSPL